MLKLAKYAAVAAVASGLGIVATEPASAWGSGYGYGDYGYNPYAYGFSRPYGHYGYRSYRHHYGYYDQGRFYRHRGW
jgi:hypothetical protein